MRLNAHKRHKWIKAICENEPFHCTVAAAVMQAIRIFWAQVVISLKIKWVALFSPYLARVHRPKMTLNDSFDQTQTQLMFHAATESNEREKKKNAHTHLVEAEIKDEKSVHIANVIRTPESGECVSLSRPSKCLRLYRRRRGRRRRRNTRTFLYVPKVYEIIIRKAKRSATVHKRDKEIPHRASNKELIMMTQLTLVEHDRRNIVRHATKREVTKKIKKCGRQTRTKNGIETESNASTHGNRRSRLPSRRTWNYVPQPKHAIYSETTIEFHSPSLTATEI